jgi:hypothetical protein
MTDQRELDRLLGAYFVEGSNELTDRVIDAALDQIDHTEQRRTRRASWRFPTMSSTPMRLATAAVIGAVVVGGTLYLNRPSQPEFGGPGPTAEASASHSQPAVGPSATPTVRPTPTVPPLIWTPASLEEDWPAPVRSEPAGGALVRPIVDALGDPAFGGNGLYRDPLGDTGSAVHPWVDIRQLENGTSKLFIELADNFPPLVEPTEQRIAYGVVVDTDRDGVPDLRYGIDNLPVAATGDRGVGHRNWRTDLHTGRTESYHIGPPYALDGDSGLDTFWPPGGYGPEGARFSFGGDVAGGGHLDGLVGPFYAWASVIEDGRVVATDYAPDVGWLDSADENLPIP